MACEYICDVCGKREAASIYKDGDFASPDGWSQKYLDCCKSDKREPPVTFCSHGCSEKWELTHNYVHAEVKKSEHHCTRCAGKSKERLCNELGNALTVVETVRVVRDPESKLAFTPEKHLDNSYEMFEIVERELEKMYKRK